MLKGSLHYALRRQRVLHIVGRRSSRMKGDRILRWQVRHRRGRLCAIARAALTPFVLALLAAAQQVQAGDRLLATGGVAEIEGSGGGGLTPWALIAGLGTDSQVGASASCTRVLPQNFALTSCGVAAGIDNRVELSLARQEFSLGDVAPGASITQTIVGAKVRLWGDAVTDQDRWWPQVAAGVQYKRNLDFDFIPRLIGAKSDHGIDSYLSATKIYLAGPFGRTWLVDVTLRATRANQFGILGFGGDRDNGYSVVAEGSVAAFLTDNVILGAEYRQKPNNLSAFREDDAHDIFMSWFAIKNFSVTAAYVDLGNIATHPDQRGLYLSLQASF
jgi:hypothetical protein